MWYNTPCMETNFFKGDVKMSNQVLFGDVPLGMRKTFNGIISDGEVSKATDLYTVYKHTRILPN